ncbi:Bin3-domain-containing protein [Polyporus arcularius HHB13444]|uniref:RNA methyltransferase n=1 Tax=Polyporus arcularius HHB13444 TaxID=1314778 RepID=A0A5C3NZU4_9APHY|nr:Bin3-domain-containing protein [Polyporus arcularius HHB13444]
MASTTNDLPVYGNYHGYYNKRPPTNDRRLALVPRGLFNGKRVLDVGCNEGIVTCEIAQTLGAKRVVGVDIDDTLVRAAWKHRRSVWSQQGPPMSAAHGTPEANGEESAQPDRRKRRRISHSDADEVYEGVYHDSAGPADYFPASCEHMFGPLPIIDVAAPGNIAEAFPHNVSFRTADWVKSEIPEDAEGYDVVVAFSISKWIHLNGGDEALLEFFRRVSDVLRAGGTFVLEPQEWETYAKAKRMDPRLKENAKNLKLRPDHFEDELRKLGFGPAQRLGTAGEGGECWKSCHLVYDR